MTPSDSVKRYVLQARNSVPDSLSGVLPTLPENRLVLVLGAVPEFAELLQTWTGSAENILRVLSQGEATRQINPIAWETNLDSPEAIAEFRKTVSSDGAQVGAVVNLLGLTAPYNLRGTADADLTLSRRLFNVFKEFHAELSRGEERLLVNVTSLDGAFGLTGKHDLPIAQAGSIGLGKALAKEWNGLRVFHVDLDPSLTPEEWLPRLWSEILSPSAELEIGLGKTDRCRLELVESSLSNKPRVPDWLNQDSVVLITGGASGITAEVALELAKTARPKLILVGRSPCPDGPCPPTHLDEPHEIRQWLIETVRDTGQSILPANIEKELKQILKRRQIAHYISAMRGAGATVEYHALDAANGDAFGNLIDNIYERLGRIDAVIHGAGIVEDRRVVNKNVESFDRVFDAKVRSAMTLARKIRPETLRACLLFSSIVARTGNAGQIDYCAGNETLNKLASQLQRTWNKRVTAINWGPWDAGMMNDDLRRLYANLGIGLIPIEVGVRMCLQEMACSNGPAEVIIAANVEAIAKAGFEAFVKANAAQVPGAS